MKLIGAAPAVCLTFEIDGQRFQRFVESADNAEEAAYRVVKVIADLRKERGLVGLSSEELAAIGLKEATEAVQLLTK
jgi:hypothetical protein